jgi:hypothetical protein
MLESRHFSHLSFGGIMKKTKKKINALACLNGGLAIEQGH